MSISQVFGNNSALAAQARSFALRELSDYLRPVAQDAVRRTDANFEQLYNTDRSGKRSKGGIPLHGSFTARVIPSNGSFPVEIRLDTIADPKKVYSLEFGSLPHVITGNPLVFPADAGAAGGVFTSPVSKGARKTAKQTRQRGAKFTDGTGGLVRTNVVMHPGTREGKFMRRGLDAAMRARLRLARSLVD